MLSISTRAAIRSAAATHPDPIFQALLTLLLGDVSPVADQGDIPAPLLPVQQH